MNRLVVSFAALLSGLLPLILDSALKGVALLALASITALALFKSSAATRHLVWLVAVVALLIVPVLSLALPEWRILPKWTAAPLRPTTELAIPTPTQTSAQQHTIATTITALPAPEVSEAGTTISAADTSLPVSESSPVLQAPRNPDRRERSGQCDHQSLWVHDCHTPPAWEAVEARVVPVEPWTSTPSRLPQRPDTTRSSNRHHRRANPIDDQRLAPTRKPGG
jgi:hypothetical protein